MAAKSSSLSARPKKLSPGAKRPSRPAKATTQKPAASKPSRAPKAAKVAAKTATKMATKSAAKPAAKPRPAAKAPPRKIGASHSKPKSTAGRRRNASRSLADVTLPGIAHVEALIERSVHSIKQSLQSRSNELERLRETFDSLGKKLAQRQPVEVLGTLGHQVQLQLERVRRALGRSPAGRRRPHHSN